MKIDNVAQYAALPAPPSSGLKRVVYLESMRGVAALQVLFMHACSAFLPSLIFFGRSAFADIIHQSPLFIIYDGYTGVYMFFVLSGYVLTKSFSRLDATIAAISISRIVRLFLPAIAACAVAFVMVKCFSQYFVEAKLIAGSPWLNPFWNVPFTPWDILKNGLIDSLGFGYAEASMIPSLESYQTSISDSLLPPLWTLSWEFYGSTLVLLLTKLRIRLKFKFVLAVVLAVVLFRSPFICFVAGWCFASLDIAERDPMFNGWIALTLAVMGFSMGVVADAWAPLFLQELAAAKTWLLYPSLGAPSIIRSFAAIVIFFGVSQSGLLRSALSSTAGRFFGRVSYPLYLIHFAILTGPAIVILVLLAAFLPVALAKILTTLAFIGLSFGAALAFEPIDQFSIKLSRLIRESMKSITIRPVKG